MPRPTLKDVSDVRTIYESDQVKVERGDLTLDGHLWHGGMYRVTVKPHTHRSRGEVAGKRRIFYGESAWSDAERMASDVDWNATGVSNL